MNTYQLIKDCEARTNSLASIIPIKEHEYRVAEIDELMSAPTAWTDNRKAAALLKERQQLIALVANINKLMSDALLLAEYAELCPDEIETLSDQAMELERAVSAFELERMMTGEHDEGNAIVTITAGSGGLESKSWAYMLFRQLLRYCDRMAWHVEIIDEKYSNEHADICLDNVTFQANGKYVYGFLKVLSGVSRLIRNSPFSSGDTRHTSFAAVNVIPDIDNNIEIVINENDLEIKAVNSGGPGGQCVNALKSAIFLKHLPSGIILKAQTERSQHENRRIALKLLKVRLYDLEVKKKEKEQNKLLSNLTDNAFGHQIISYTLSPFQLIKAHRSGYETNKTDQILDGDMQELILAELKARL